MLQDSGAAPLGARLEALEKHAALDEDGLHLEGVDVSAVVVLGIGDRRFEQLAHDRGAFLRREGEDAHRLVDGLAADEIGHQPALLRREPRAAQACFGFHHFFPAGAGAGAGAAPGAAAGGCENCVPGASLRGSPTASSVRLPTAEWLLKMRVSANSPSLCPTMFSVTYTGTCCLPLCTASVRPTNSGTMVERRDQVLIGRLSLVLRAASTFFIRWWSTKGPFLIERDMAWPFLFHAPVADDHHLRPLVATGLESFGLNAPRRNRRLPRRRAAFAAAVRMVDRVHRHAAHRRANAPPALASCLADRLEVVLGIAGLADGGAAVDVHLADLARAQPQLRVGALAREHLHPCARRAQCPSARRRSGARRRRRAAARGARCGSGRIRDALRAPRCRPCRAGSRPRGSAACGRRPCAAW